MNAQEARLKTNEAIEKNKIEADIADILQNILDATKDEQYYVKLLRSTLECDKHTTYISDRQIAKLTSPNFGYIVEFATEHEEYETLNYIIIKW